MRVKISPGSRVLLTKQKTVRAGRGLKKIRLHGGIATSDISELQKRLMNIKPFGGTMKPNKKYISL